MTPQSSAAEGRDRSVHFAGLDVIRICAALMVMFHHLGWRVWAHNYAVPMSYHFLAPFAGPGFVGVEIFFVLSGFLIAYSANHATARSFVVHRALRLYPAAWICATLMIGIVFALGQGHMLLRGVPFSDHLLARWTCSMLLTPVGLWVDGVYWTLAIELGFYLQVWLLLRLGRLRLLGAWMTIVGLVSTALLALAIYSQQQPHATKWLVRIHDALFLNQIAFDLLLRHGCFFAIGVLLWLYLLQGWRGRHLAALLLMLPGAWLELRFASGPRLWYVQAAIWAVAVAGMVASVAAREHIAGLLGQTGSRIARWLGGTSYPLYLLHQSTGYAMLAALKPYLPDLVNLAVVMTTLSVAAYLIFRYMERPLQNLLKAKFVLAR